MTDLDRRQLLVGLLATAACGSRGPSLPEGLTPLRTWPGRGGVVVVATAHGDPRLPTSRCPTTRSGTG